MNNFRTLEENVSHKNVLCFGDADTKIIFQCTGCAITVFLNRIRFLCFSDLSLSCNIQCVAHGNMSSDGNTSVF